MGAGVAILVAAHSRSVGWNQALAMLPATYLMYSCCDGSGILVSGIVVPYSPVPGGRTIMQADCGGPVTAHEAPIDAPVARAVVSLVSSVCKKGLEPVISPRSSVRATDLAGRNDNRYCMRRNVKWGYCADPLFPIIGSYFQPSGRLKIGSSVDDGAWKIASTTSSGIRSGSEPDKIRSTFAVQLPRLRMRNETTRILQSRL